MLTMLQANIAGAKMLATPLADRLARIAHIVETRDVHYVAIQAGSDADGMPEPIAALAALLPRHRVILQHDGLALLASVAADAIGVVPLHGLGLQDDPNARAVLLARGTDGPTVVVAHMSWAGEQAMRNVADVLAAIEAHDDVVLLGDFNQTPDSAAIAALIDAGFDDPWPRVHGAGGGFTYEIGKPWGRLDYVLTRGSATVGAIELLADTPESAVSDHALLLARLA